MSNPTYRPDGATLLRYMTSTASLVCIQGPVRSGKSVASAMRMYKAMMEVPKGADGVRRSRWLIIRNSYPDLEQSTIKTWLHWFPESVYGRFGWSPPYTHDMKFGDVEAEVVFESFVGEEDIPSLKSREYTGIWINEAQFYSLKFVVACMERTGWYPRPDGPKWVQLDMNAPPFGHWVPMMRGDAPIPDEMDESDRMSLRKPDDWEFLMQPAWFREVLDAQGAVDKYVIDPGAENLRIVGERAVYELLSGRTKAQIDADLMNRVTILTAGKPVFPMFRQETHIAKARLQPFQGLPLYVGLDFGRRPAAVFAQRSGGRWFVLGEVTAENMAAVKFAPIVRQRLAAQFPAWLREDGPGIEFWGDPSGASARGETDDQTAFQVWAAAGMAPQKADNRGLRTIRIETATRIMESSPGGLPGLLISPACPVLTTGLGGGYVYRRKKVSGAPTYETEPDKDGPFSHPIDALLEIFMGAGEAKVTLGRERTKKPIRNLTHVNVFGRTASAWARRA